MIDQWNTRLFEGRYREFFAVTADEQVVGYVQLTEQPDGSVGVDVHIFSDFRGKTYGTQSVRKLLSLAKEKGYCTVTARVRKNNVPSCRLCETVGFVRTGEGVTAKGQDAWNLIYSLSD